MKYSGIGGQSVMEGVMMRNGKDYAIAVRKPDQEIEVKVEKGKASLFDDKWNKIPIIRGILNFIDSLVLGISTLMFSASFFEVEEEDEPKEKKGRRKEKEKKEVDPETAEKQEKAMMGFVLVISLVIAVAVFMILPYYLSELFQRAVSNQTLVAIFEGVIRLVIFIVYIVLIAQMEDIKRTFMYHGAEHKCINCVEHGLDLTVENVRISSREHKRCGTSFLVFVVIICIILYLFIRVDSHALRITIRIILIPVIAGLSYELLRAAGRYDNKFIQIISKPGMWVQQLTVSEPDDDMIEVGIASVEAVFDWRSFVKEVRQEEGIEVIGEEESDASASGEESAPDTEEPPAEEETAEEIAEENPAGIDASRDEEFWL